MIGGLRQEEEPGGTDSRIDDKRVKGPGGEEGEGGGEDEPPFDHALRADSVADVHDPKRGVERENAPLHRGHVPVLVAKIGGEWEDGRSGFLGIPGHGRLRRDYTRFDSLDSV